MGRGWWVHVLNVKALNMVRKCCSKAPLFSSVAGTGRGMGPEGGSERAGHPHERFTSGSGGCSSCDGPLAWLLPGGGAGVLFGEPRPGSGMVDAAAADVRGNPAEMMPRSEQAFLLRNSLVTLGVTYTICLDVAVESVRENSRRMAPKIWMPLLLAACIR